MSVYVNTDEGTNFDASRAIQRFALGDSRSGDELAGHIRHIVRRRLRRLSASDQECDELMQDCAIGVLQRIGEYRQDFGSFDGWVSGFAQNAWRSYLRSMTRQRRSVVSMDEVSSAHYEIASEINQRENLSVALESLDLVDQELLHLRYSMGMSSDEIAAASDMNAPQVRKRISRAVERLRRHPAIESLLLSISLL